MPSCHDWGPLPFTSGQLQQKWDINHYKVFWKLCIQFYRQIFQGSMNCFLVSFIQLNIWWWVNDMKMKFSYIICVLIIWPNDNCQIHQTILSFQVKRILMPSTVETLYSTIYYSKYFIELNFDKSTQYVALWTHKRHPIPRPFGRAMECLLWVLQHELTVL